MAISKGQRFPVKFEDAFPSGLVMRPVDLDGLTAQPRVAGNGEFKYLSYLFRATGFRAAPSATGSGSPGGSSRAGQGEKARLAGSVWAGSPLPEGRWRL